MREFSTPLAVTVDDSASLTDAVWHNAATHPDTPQFTLRSATSWREVTCRQFRDEVTALARGLLAVGVSPGDRVALMSRTRYEWTLADYAILSAGAVTVPIFETSSPEQVEWIVSNSGAAACFVETAAHRATVERHLHPDRVWHIEGGAIGDLIAKGAGVASQEIDRRRHAVRADDLATIVYTSGTTGRPRGCMLTHRNILADIGNAIPPLRDLLHERASTLLFLPLAHAFARLIQFGVVQVRVRTAYTPDTTNLLDDLTSFRPTFVLAVPRVFEKIYNQARQRAKDHGAQGIFAAAENTAVAYSQAVDRTSRTTPRKPGMLLRARRAAYDWLVYRRLRATLGGRCRAAISGGAPLSPRLCHFFRGAGITVLEGYGLTETSAACTVNVPGHMRIGTVGRPLPGVTVRVNDDGEVLVRGDNVFAGYWNDAQATAKVMDGEGFLHSGDLGELDDEGYLMITGRKKEIIVTAGGKNVIPTMLEDRVRAHPLVSHCMVVGEGRPFIGALITIDEDAFRAWRAEHGKPATATVADLRDDPDLRAEIQGAVDEANQSVSRAESIRAFRILTGDFTETNGMLTPSLKVKRTVVAREHADEIAAIYR